MQKGPSAPGRVTFEHINEARRQHVHNISREIAEEHSLIGMEDLNTQRMMEHAPSHKLAGAIGSASWHMLTRMIAYKAAEAGTPFVLVDPYNTSQKCSRCGEQVPKDLTVRRYMCPYCGLDTDRDLNAAVNILSPALQTAASKT